jgi:hypothetical protein
LTELTELGDYGINDRKRGKILDGINRIIGKDFDRRNTGNMKNSLRKAEVLPSYCSCSSCPHQCVFEIPLILSRNLPKNSVNSVKIPPGFYNSDSI